MSPSILLLFSKTIIIFKIVVYSGSLEFSYKFYKQLVSFCQEASWGFDGMACCAWDTASTPPRVGVGWSKEGWGRNKAPNLSPGIQFLQYTSGRIGVGQGEAPTSCTHPPGMDLPPCAGGGWGGSRSWLKCHRFAALCRFNIFSQISGVFFLYARRTNSRHFKSVCVWFVKNIFTSYGCFSGDQVCGPLHTLILNVDLHHRLLNHHSQIWYFILFF